jgi:zinc protease
MLLSGCLTVSAERAAGRGVVSAGDPPLEIDGDTTQATVNGLTIIVRRLPEAELTSATLYIKGGARNWTRENAGIERFACGVAISAGPRGMTKQAYKRRQIALGGELSISTTRDFTELRAKGLAGNWDETFDLLMDVFLDPALPEEEVGLRRSQLLTELEQEGDNPDRQLRIMATRLMFKGHVFENSPDGTADNLNRLQRKDLVAYLATLRETSRLLLVVAGNVDPARVIARAGRRLGALPRGHHVDSRMPPLGYARANLATQPRKLPTNYVTAHFAGPPWTDDMFPASGIAIDLLSARLFTEVRSKRGLSYAPYATIAADSYLPIGILHVTTTEPNAAMKVMLDEVRRLQSELVSARELRETKSVFLTRYLSLLDTTDGIVGVLGSAHLYTGDWRLARRLPERMRAVTVEDIRAFARRYLVNLQTVVLGDPSKVDSAIFLGR